MEKYSHEKNRAAAGNLTTRQGHPVTDNQNITTIGPRGPATLENYHFLEKMSHFDRERIPERVVHARGFVAHGEFVAYGKIGDKPASEYTRADLFQERHLSYNSVTFSEGDFIFRDRITPVTVRFSTVIGSAGSSETARDPRGFAVKFKTREGNWDLVGNNLQIFFIRDAMKFPDFIHAFKPDPITNRQEPNRMFDFLSFAPESMLTLTWLFSSFGIPKDYMHMRGSGVNTYKLVNSEGKAVLCKFHWLTQQGEANLTQREAEQIQASDLAHSSKATFEAIQSGKYPKWELCVQIMEDRDHSELDFDPLDDTKIWPHEDFPLLPVGMMTLNKNAEDFFLENEQSAFGTGVLVDGIDFSDDKMLIGRSFSYSDTQRYRVGPNYLQLHVNAPLHKPNTNLTGGPMQYYRDGHGESPHVNYEPSIHGLKETASIGPMAHTYYDAGKTRQTILKENNYGQARRRYHEMGAYDRDELISNVVTLLGKCDTIIKERMVGHWIRVDEGLGATIAKNLGVKVDAATAAVEQVDKYWAQRGRPHAGSPPEIFLPTAAELSP